MGKSSARMCQVLLAKYPDSEIVFICSNTSEEEEESLIFGQKVDKHLGLNLVLVEGVFNAMNEGTTHRVVTFETAARKGEVFEAMIQKYGIPNQDYPHCTRELKTNPMYSYIASIGWEPGTYSVALGIRADEPQRIRPWFAAAGVFLPLVEEGIDKTDVNDMWGRCTVEGGPILGEMPFTLNLLESEGNCKWCWKKSERKHIQNIKRHRDWYDFPKRMEQNYTLARADLSPKPRVFFRGDRSTDQLLSLADICNAQIDLFEEDPDESTCSSSSCEIEIPPPAAFAAGAHGNSKGVE